MSKKSTRILFLDDEQGILDLYSRLFKGYNDLEVVTELKSITALSKAAIWDNFDLIVTDICMPGMDGFAFINRINALNKHIPIIVISGYNSEKIIKEAVKCEHVIPKPFQCEYVERTILSILNKKCA